MLCWVFKVPDIFYSPTLICTDLYNFVPDLFGELLCLHGAACLVVPLAQWLGLSKQVYIYTLRSCDSSCDTDCTRGIYLTNYATSEGNLLHQILFRGFLAMGVNTYAHTTFPFLFVC